jgi:hypothetical protein
MQNGGLSYVKYVHVEHAYLTKKPQIQPVSFLQELKQRLMAFFNLKPQSLPVLISQGLKRALAASDSPYRRNHFDLDLHQVSREAEDKRHLKLQIAVQEEVPPQSASNASSESSSISEDGNPHRLSVTATGTSSKVDLISRPETKRISEPCAELQAVQVVSNVILANDAFEHVIGRFDKLATVLGHANILAEDFIVEVGFLQELNNAQGVYFSCQKTLSEELSDSLIEIFHPFPYILLPLSESLTSGRENLHSSPPYSVLSSTQDKREQWAPAFEDSSGGGSGSGEDGGSGGGGGSGGDGGDGGGGGGGGGSGSGNGRGSDRGGNGGGGSGGSSSGGGGEGHRYQEEDSLSCDFISTVKFQGAQGGIQITQMRANISTKVQNYGLHFGSANMVLDSINEVQPMDIGNAFEARNLHHSPWAVLFKPLHGRDGPRE